MIVKRIPLDSSIGKWEKEEEEEKEVIANIPSGINNNTISNIWVNKSETVVSSVVEYVFSIMNDGNSSLGNSSLGNVYVSNMLEPYCGLINLYYDGLKDESRYGMWYLTAESSDYKVYYNFITNEAGTSGSINADNRKYLMSVGEPTFNHNTGGYVSLNDHDMFSKNLFVCEDTVGLVDKKPNDNYIIYNRNLDSVYSSSVLQFDKIKLDQNNWGYIERKNGSQTICLEYDSFDGFGTKIREYGFNQISNTNSFLKGSLRKSAVESNNQIFYIGLSDSSSDNVIITKINLK